MSDSLTATFTAGSDTTSVSFPVVLDNIVEPMNETFDMFLTELPGQSIRIGNLRNARAFIIDSTGIITIVLLICKF